MPSRDEPGIDMYQDLELIGLGPDDSFNLFFKCLDDNLNYGWTRNVREEKSVKLPREARCYHCDSAGIRKAANLWISKKNRATWEISNVVPDEYGKLTFSEYNTILMDFFNHFIKKDIHKFGIKAHLKDSKQYLSEFLNPRVFELFCLFSNAANKSTGSGHPSDEDRWFQFLFEVFDTGGYKTLYPSTLGRFLEEAYGWDKDVAYELSIEYENYLRFLDRYLKHAGIKSEDR